MQKEHVLLDVKGMTCTHCSKTVSGIIEQEGGTDIHVDFLMGEAEFDLNTADKLEDIRTRIERAGYEASIERRDSEGLERPLVEKKFLWTLPFSLVLFSHMFLPHDSWINIPLVQLALATPVVIIGLSHFGKNVVESLRVGATTMDVLIVLGSMSAFFYSIYGTFMVEGHAQHEFLFYETTTTIITLVLLGYVIEHRAVLRTTSELRSLFKLKPEKAKKLVGDGLNQVIEVVKVEELRVDDMVLVNTGDKIPSDGIIAHGEIQVDESMLTGESISISKSKAAQVLGGSVIQDGSATVKITKATHEGTLSQIIKLVKKSRADRPEIQRLADKMSAWFVPTILILSGLTLVINFFILSIPFTDAFLRSIAVLVISCPCAMGLATPTAVSVGLGLAAKAGIVVKRASTLEELNHIVTIAFDKTGTLTEGLSTIQPNWRSSKYDQETILDLVSTIEKHSNHPLSKLLIDPNRSDVGLEDLKEIKGKGLEAAWEGKKVRLGSALFTNSASELGSIFLTIDGEAIVDFEVSEELKARAKDVVQELKAQSFDLLIMSGDLERKTAKIAEELQISNYHAQMLPEEKLERLRTEKATKNIAMIGDGINDAPSLAEANIGISIGNANALAAEAAEIVLLNSSLSSVPRLFNISKHVVKTIKQNLFWAVAYNVVAIPLAAFGYLDPMLAALSMAFSDVVVIGNSVRLRYTLPQQVN